MKILIQELKERSKNSLNKVNIPNVQELIKEMLNWMNTRERIMSDKTRFFHDNMEIKWEFFKRQIYENSKYKITKTEDVIKKLLLLSEYYKYIINNILLLII